jgi:hypothetical protein
MLLTRLPALFYVPYALLSILLPSQYEQAIRESGETHFYFSLCFTLLFAYTVGHILLVASNLKAIPLADILLANLPAMFLCLAAVRSSQLFLPIVLTAIFLSGSFWAWKRQLQTGPGANQIIMVLWALCYLALLAGILYQPVAFPRALGPLLILEFGLGQLAILALFLAFRPRIAATMIALFFVSALLTPRNFVDIPRTLSVPGSWDLVRGFDKWLAARKDVSEYKNQGRPYPIILVSSEGGGIYAAAHAYSVLLGMQLRCPSFAQHIFSTVGVSGGAVGNLLFANTTWKGMIDGRPLVATLNKPVPCHATRHEIDMSAIVEDHLSPVIARALFFDLPLTFFPWRFSPADRARALIQSFQNQSQPDDLLSKSVRDAWSESGNTPLLISVATDVSKGQRFIFSPLTPGGSLAEWFPNGAVESSIEFSQPGPDVSVGDAAIASARFPWLTATGRLEAYQGSFRLLADGGYFENSGAETTTEIFRTIRAHALETQSPDAIERADPRSPHCRLILEKSASAKSAWEGCDHHIFLIHLVISKSYATPLSQANGFESDVNQSFLFDPIAAMLSTREARGQLALERAESEFSWYGLSTDETNTGQVRAELPINELKLPLGWNISKRDAAIVAALSVPMEHCSSISETLGSVDSETTGRTRSDEILASLKKADSNDRISSDEFGAFRGWPEVIEANGCAAATLAGLFDLSKANGR